MSDVAAEQAAKNAREMANEYTTPTDILEDYVTDDVVTTSGRIFKVESMLPGNLMIDIGSPVIREFTETEENKPDIPEDEKLSPQEEQALYQHIKNIVCMHTISIKFSLSPQHLCRENVVSIDRLEREEVLEIYRGIRDLSVKEAATFQEAGDENSPE